MVLELWMDAFVWFAKIQATENSLILRYEESLVKPTGYNWEEDKRAGKPLRVVENRFSGNSQKLETTETWMHFRGGRT